MTLAASSATQPTPVDALSPLHFPGDLQLTPEQFWTVCSANPDAVLELDASGLALKLFDSSSGFHLGWLLIPHQQAVEIWPRRSPEARSC
jgi:hypothetical protein